MDTRTHHSLSLTARPEHPVILQIRHGYSRALQRDGWWLDAPVLRNALPCANEHHTSSWGSES